MPTSFVDASNSSTEVTDFSRLFMGCLSWDRLIIPEAHRRSSTLARRPNPLREPEFISRDARDATLDTAPLRGMAPKAVERMVVDDADRLHPRVDDHRADELESARLQFARHPLRK